MANLEGHRFRERVYCYELYHQLRLALPANFLYTLQGEVDKMGHPIITGGVKPDFILHKSGTMNDNFLVIEVKPLNNTRSRQIKKGFRYSNGIFRFGKRLLLRNTSNMWHIEKERRGYFQSNQSLPRV